MSEPTICAKCRASTEMRDEYSGRLGAFLHISCFDAWWRSEYTYLYGPYYRWMRQGMCLR